MTTQLASIAVEGFRSIRSMELNLSSEVTLLIGANGAGKSNVVDALALLGNVIDRQLQAAVDESGGFSNLIHRSSADPPEEIAIKVWGGWDRAWRNGYEMRLRPGVDDTAILTESTKIHKEDFERPRKKALRGGSESALPGALKDNAPNQYLHDILSGVRVFHFDDTDRVSAPPLRTVSIADGETLHDDARNIAAVLYEMKAENPSAYQAVRRSVRNIAPFFEDFVLRPNRSERIRLRWRERGIDDVFPGSALSSGTLRFICLSVLLQQPNAPGTIVLDEPELGLHPAAIHQLAALMRLAGNERRIIAATQSVTLLGQFGIEDIAVVERRDGATVVNRPPHEELEEWLDEYSVGELWEMSVLGGRPGSERAPR